MFYREKKLQADRQVDLLYCISINFSNQMKNNSVF